MRRPDREPARARSERHHPDRLLAAPARAIGQLSDYQRAALGFGSKAIWPLTEAFRRDEHRRRLPVSRRSGRQPALGGRPRADRADPGARQHPGAPVLAARLVDALRQHHQRRDRRAARRRRRSAARARSRRSTFAAADAAAMRRIEDERYAWFMEASVIDLDLPDAVYRGYEGDDRAAGRAARRRSGAVRPAAPARSCGSSRRWSTSRSGSAAMSTTSCAAMSASGCCQRAGAGSCPAPDFVAGRVVLRGLPVRVVERLQGLGVWTDARRSTCRPASRRGAVQRHQRRHRTQGRRHARVRQPDPAALRERPGDARRPSPATAARVALAGGVSRLRRALLGDRSSRSDAYAAVMGRAAAPGDDGRAFLVDRVMARNHRVEREVGDDDSRARRARACRPADDQSAARAIAAPSATGSCGGTSRPVRRCSIISGTPPTSVATTGRRSAIASRMARPCASRYDGSTATSSAAVTAGHVVAQPVKRTLAPGRALARADAAIARARSPSRSSDSAWASSSSRCEPSPTISSRALRHLGQHHRPRLEQRRVALLRLEPGDHADQRRALREAVLLGQRAARLCLARTVQIDAVVDRARPARPSDPPPRAWPRSPADRDEPIHRGVRRRSSARSCLAAHAARVDRADDVRPRQALARREPAPRACRRPRRDTCGCGRSPVGRCAEQLEHGRFRGGIVRARR